MNDSQFFERDRKVVMFDNHTSENVVVTYKLKDIIHNGRGDEYFNISNNRKAYLRYIPDEHMVPIYNFIA